MSVVFKPVPLKDYEGGGFKTNLNFPFWAIKAVLGEPWRNYPIRKNDNYPDDDDKTDVCWCVKSPEGHRITVWNYKNGPAYGETTQVEDLDSFSADYTDQAFFEAVKALIAVVASGLTVVTNESALQT